MQRHVQIFETHLERFEFAVELDKNSKRWVQALYCISLRRQESVSSVAFASLSPDKSYNIINIEVCSRGMKRISESIHHSAWLIRPLNGYSKTISK